MSQPQYTDVQLLTSQILLEGVDPVRKQFLSDNGWSEKHIKKLMYTIHFRRMAMLSKEPKNREIYMQYFLAALSVHKGFQIVLPPLLSLYQLGDTAPFIEDKNAMNTMGKALFKDDDFKNYKYESRRPNVQLGDITGCHYKVKHECPKGVVVLFEKKVSYLIERTSKVPMFFRNPDGKKKRRNDIKELVSAWDEVSIQSVAMAVRYDQSNNVYVRSGSIVYVILKMSPKAERKFTSKVGGGGSLKIASQSNLKQYVPSDRWKTFKVDIEKAIKKFDKDSAKLLNSGSEETKAKLRAGFDQLNMYYQNSDHDVVIDYDEPEEVEARIAGDGEAANKTSDDDTGMSDASEASNESL